MLVQLLLMTGLGLVSAQSCCSPDQWEANIGFVQGFATPGNPEVDTGLDALHFDFINKKFAVRTSTDPASGIRPTKVIRDYNMRMQYIIQLDTGLCSRRELSGPMGRACSPDGAVKLPRVTFGAGPDLSTVNVYLLTTPSVTNSFVFTEELCVPFVNTIWGDVTGTGVPSLQVYGWQNLTLGIKDPSVFDIPSSCNTGLKQEHHPVKLSQCMGFVLDLY